MFLKNWLPSIFGVSAGVLNMLANGTNWKQIVFSAALAVLGVVSKQFNVTGGSVPQTIEASARVK